MDSSCKHILVSVCILSLAPYLPSAVKRFELKVVDKSLTYIICPVYFSHKHGFPVVRHSRNGMLCILFHTCVLDNQHWSSSCLDEY